MDLFSRYFLRFAGGFLLCVTLNAHGQTTTGTDAAEALYRSAVELSAQAEAAQVPGEVIEKFNRAIARCDLATKNRPDFYQAQALAAHCYYRLTQTQSIPSAHAGLVKTARERFALAALCTGTEDALYREWGTMLMGEADPAMPQPGREAILREARRVFEAGLTRSGPAVARPGLECDLGYCLVLLSKNSNDTDDKQSLCEEGLRHFAIAAKNEAFSSGAELPAYWGIGLVERSKLNGNRTALRQGVERLETALERGSRNQDVHYYLSCAYAVLGRNDQALSHLRICLNNEDGRRFYYKAAATDPDLRSLEQVPAYNALFDEKQAVSAGSLVKPALSDR